MPGGDAGCRRGTARRCPTGTANFSGNFRSITGDYPYDTVKAEILLNQLIHLENRQQDRDSNKAHCQAHNQDHDGLNH